MASLRKLVSDIRATHKLLSSDGLINDRVIASELRNNTYMLLKRETNLRRLWNSDTIFTTIPCLEMKKVPLSECCGYNDPCTIARSVHKLPKLAEGIYSYLIQGVYSINALGGNGTKLKEISVNRYTNLLKLPIIKKEEYYFIVDGYLFVTNPDVKLVRITALFEEDISDEIMFPDCDCNSSNREENKCLPTLDKEFSLPGYMYQSVLDLTSKRLLTTYFNLKSDMSNEGIDGQAPNAPNLT